VKRQSEQKSARERLADIPLSNQDTRKISADQLAEVLARVDGKRERQAAEAREESEGSGARPVATRDADDDASSERVIQRLQAPPAPASVSSAPSSTQRVPSPVDPSITTTLPLRHPAPAAAAALIPAAPAPKPGLTRVVVLLFILAALLSALYAVVRR
jgi:hypothetical protein